jgi:hypothetical protein
VGSRGNDAVRSVPFATTLIQQPDSSKQNWSGLQALSLPTKIEEMSSEKVSRAAETPRKLYQTAAIRLLIRRSSMKVNQGRKREPLRTGVVRSYDREIDE